jgi:DNA-binding NarL/FixJ family response regulator
MGNADAVLLAGGCRTDWRAVEGALAELGLGGCVAHAPDVDEALALLKTKSDTLPRVVVLSVQADRDDRLATLKAFKGDAQLRSVPVVVLANSHDASLVNDSFALGAAGYLAEPSDCRRFAEALRRIHNYWSLSELPHRR